MNPNAKPFTFNAGVPAPAPLPPQHVAPPPPPEEKADEEIDENDPLWQATLKVCNGDREAAVKMLEDPDVLMTYPEIRKIMEGTVTADDWDTDPITNTSQSNTLDVIEPKVISAESVSAPSPTIPASIPDIANTTTIAETGEDAADDDAVIVDGDPREHLNLVFIGHVDAGKSTLSGNILYITGMVDQRTIERYEREAKQRNRESWFLAFILDTSEEERARGKTVEVGRAYFATAKNRYTVLDAPGHKNYVPNMISGATQADVGILVISGRRGEFETGFEKGGQTREHALLAKTLGVRYLIVVINKMDDPTVLWSQERFEECCNKLKPYLKSCGYAIKKEVRFIPISALSGDNLLNEVSVETCPWWKGVAAASGTLPTLFSILDSLVISGRDPEAALRLPVLDRYFERGTVIMGKVETGTLRMGDEVAILPTRNKAKVEAIYIGEMKVRSAKPGENVLIKMNVNLDDIQKGYVLCSPNNICPAVSEFKVELALIDMLEHRPIFSSGYDCVMHLHTAEVEVTCVQLISVTDNKGQTMRRPFAKTGQKCIALLRTPQTTSMEPYNKVPSLGRVTLRDEGRTIAIGKIVEVSR